MKFRFVHAAALTLALLAPQAQALRSHRGPTSGGGVTQRQQRAQSSSKRRPAAQARGQRVIDPTRTTQIQQALVAKGYLVGTPNGQWDSATDAAMTRFQSDNGWQTKLTPDSRALIKLGLGPKTVTTAENEPAPAVN